MSKLETPLTRRFWKQTGGTLVEEFTMVKPSGKRGKRLVDAIIIPSGPRAVKRPREVQLAGQHVIVVQTKASRLSMSLVGQALVSKRLVAALGPRSVRSVAVCTKGDSVLEPVAEELGVEVVVYAVR